MIRFHWFSFVLLWSSLSALPGRALDLVASGTDWRYLKGLVEASSPDTTAWRTDAFNDAGWPVGPATFWYGDVFPGTQITDMQNSYSSLFFRKRFTVVSPADIEGLVLRARCDDGFVAWINGKEVARYNVPAGELPFNAFALAAANPDPAETLDHPIVNPAAVLAPGDNVLAVQVLNVALTSSDIVWDAVLQATIDDTVPVVVNRYPPAGAAVRELVSVEVEFSEAVQGVDAADLRVGGIAATGVSTVSPAQYVFTFGKIPPGKVDVAFRTGHGITDQAGTPHPFAGGSWSYTVDPALRPPGLEISEFLADNASGLRDEDGDKSDWIELHNGAALPQSLAGWSLSDDPEKPAKWRFPAITMPAGGYQVVFASGKDRTDTAGRLHTNFKLGSAGGFLGLASPGGEIVSSFGAKYPPQRADVSYGRATGAGDIEGYFVKPTPGTANSTHGAGFAPDVVFSATGRTFTADFDLSLSLDGPAAGAVIRYTVDGAPVTEASVAYTGPITVVGTARIRARAFATGLLPGAPGGEIFLRLAPNAVPFTSDLPVMVIHNFGAGRPPATGSQNAVLQLFEPVAGVTSLTHAPTLSVRAGIGARGSSTLGNAKVSMSMELHDELDASADHALLGMPAESDWVLYAPNGFEPVLVHNPFAHQLSRDIGRYSPRTRFVELYLVTSGAASPVTTTTYYGIYVLEEKIKRGKDRVDIDGLTAADTKAPQVTGGYMMKIDRGGPGESGFGAANAGIIYVDPKEREIRLPERAAQRTYLQSYMDSFGSALYGPDWKDPVKGYAAFIEPGSWVDHHLLNVITLNVDALRLSANFYKPRGGKLEFGPLWDFDRALGSTDGRDFNPKSWRGVGGDAGTDFFNETTQAWWGRLFQDPGFFQRYIDRYQDLRRSQFATTNLWALVADLTGQLAQAQPRERTRWGTGYRTASGAGGGSYATEVQWMKNWLSNRVEFMDSQFVRPTAITSRAGRFTNSTEVVLAPPAAGSAYYTLDGTDPRTAGGGISASAKLHDGAPIVLSANARLVARVQNPAHTARTGANNPPLVSRWSGPVAATFYSEVPPLLMTEIMFHPAPAPVGSTNSAGDFEFVELKNTSARTLSLAGFQITGAVTFRFPADGPVTSLAPGGRVLVVRDRAAFLSRYPGTTGIAGEYNGHLSDGDERIRIVGPLNEPVSDFAYDQAWAPLADGFGFSLALADETIGPDLLGEAIRWRPSARTGGSPGTAEPAPTIVQPVRVNEVLAHSDPPLLDSIELLNTGTAPQDIGGWWLTDDYRTPKKFRIPAGTVLSAGGYRVFDESHFRTGVAAFSLSSLGDSAHLFSADAAGELTGWHDGTAFGASRSGVSFGRVATSDGIAHLVAQPRRTLGAANAGPLVGPVVVTEIHFQPLPVAGEDPTADEFIELRNVSSGAVTFFDPAHATNRWQLRGEVDLDFPSGFSLGGGGFALAVGFDPVGDPARLATFRTRSGVPAGIPVVGPWRGSLDNAGGRVRLLAPDAPVPAPAANAGDVGYVVVDEIRYRPDAPWPSDAAGTGRSLQRVSSLLFGEEPQNWTAATPTPGRQNSPTDGLGTDPDGDGLPSDWEIAHGLDPDSAIGADGADGDPDNDGFTNAQEFAAGTDPRAATSRLRLEVVAADGSRLRFQAQGGRSYTVRVRTALEAGTWQVLRSIASRPTAEVIEINDPVADTTRFYQISTP